MSGPSRGVVVVTYRHADDIVACLASLGDESRVVVVDNASDDGTAAVVAEQFPHVELVRSPENVGFARAVNLGIERVAPLDVLVLNPDAVVGPTTVDDLATALAAHPHAGMVAPRLLSPDGSVQDSVRSFKTVQTLLARRTPYGSTRRGRAVLAAHLGGTAEIDPTAGAVPVDWALGAALYVRRKAIDAVGPLDPRFFLYEEDADWCARMWAGGWQVLYAPWIVASHGYRRESRRTWDLRHAPTRHHWASIFRFLLKHPGMVLLGRSPRPVAGHHP
ncbi:MAG TPA: glycosyltransferase family 2 protein [Acidimicrobiales bacterium]